MSGSIDIERTRPVRTLFAFGLPLLIGGSATLVSSLVDVAMIGHYSQLSLVSVASANVIFDIVTNLVVASCVGFQILAARYLGGSDLRAVRAAFWRTFTFAGSVGIVALFVLVFLGGSLSAWIASGPQEIESIAQSYIVARSPSLLLIVPFTLLMSEMSASKRPRQVMAAGLVATSINIGLDALLIYGLGPFPELGATGSGLATTASIAAALVYLLVARQLRPAGTPPRLGPNATSEFETSIVRLSWPVMVSTGVDYLGIALFFVIVGQSGGSALSGGRIAFELEGLMFITLSSFGAATRVMAGRALGADDLATTKLWWRAGRRLLITIAVPLAIVFILAPGLVVRIFTSFESVISSAEIPVMIVGVSLVSMAFSITNLSVLRALGRTKWDMWINIACVWGVQLPVSWLFAELFELGVAGAFWGLFAYWTVRAVLSQIICQRGLRIETANSAALQETI